MLGLITLPRLISSSNILIFQFSLHCMPQFFLSAKFNQACNLNRQKTFLFLFLPILHAPFFLIILFSVVLLLILTPFWVTSSVIFLYLVTSGIKKLTSTSNTSCEYYVHITILLKMPEKPRY